MDRVARGKFRPFIICKNRKVRDKLIARSLTKSSPSWLQERWERFLHWEHLVDIVRHTADVSVNSFCWHGFAYFIPHECMVTFMDDIVP